MQKMVCISKLWNTSFMNQLKYVCDAKFCICMYTVTLIDRWKLCKYNFQLDWDANEAYDNINESYFKVSQGHLDTRQTEMSSDVTPQYPSLIYETLLARHN